MYGVLRMIDMYTHHLTLIDRSYKYGHDVVDCLGERDLSYPVQSSDSTDVKQIPHSQNENETLSGSLDSGFSRCVISLACFMDLFFTVMDVILQSFDISVVSLQSADVITGHNHH